MNATDAYFAIAALAFTYTIIVLDMVLRGPRPARRPAALRHTKKHHYKFKRGA